MGKIGVVHLKDGERYEICCGPHLISLLRLKLKHCIKIYSGPAVLQYVDYAPIIVNQIFVLLFILKHIRVKS